MDQKTVGYILLGAAALIIALLILLLVRSKKTENNDLSARLQRLQSDLEHSVQADILALGKYLMQTGQTQSEAESRALAGAEVVAERPVSQSEINKAAAGAGGIASVAATLEVVKTVAEAKDDIESIWSMAVPLLLLLAIGLCGYVIWQRVRVRKEGWS